MVYTRTTKIENELKVNKVAVKTNQQTLIKAVEIMKLLIQNIIHSLRKVTPKTDKKSREILVNASIPL